MERKVTKWVLPPGKHATSSMIGFKVVGGGEGVDRVVCLRDGFYKNNQGSLHWHSSWWKEQFLFGLFFKVLNS